MPKETFFNLSEEKKKRIFDGAVLEFSRVSFKEASINQIIREARIPRGSFYQYFENKEDVYSYVLEEIGKEKIAVFRQYQIPENGDFLQVMKITVKALFAWAKSRPLYNRIGLFLAQDSSGLYQRVSKRQENSREFLLQMLRRDQERGTIRQEIDLELVVELLFSISQSVLTSYYVEGSTEAVCFEKLDRFFDLLYRGIKAQEEV